MLSLFRTNNTLTQVGLIGNPIENTNLLDCVMARATGRHNWATLVSEMNTLKIENQKLAEKVSGMSKENHHIKKLAASYQNHLKTQNDQPEKVPKEVAKIWEQEIQTLEKSLKDAVSTKKNLEKDLQEAKTQVKELSHCNEEMADSRKCKVCFERTHNIVLLPCAHLVLCEICADVLTKCPLCTVTIQNRVKVFES